MSTTPKLQLTKAGHNYTVGGGGGAISGFGPQQQQPPTDIYTACFEASLDEELKEQALSSSFRASFEKIGSPYGFIRNEGLREALQRLCDLSLEAAEEAARSAETTPKGTSSGGAGTAVATPHVPFDAIRSAVMPREAADPHGAQLSASAVSCRSESWERTQRALHGAHYTAAVFRRVLVPRVDERSRYNPGEVVGVELSEKAALVWNTLNHVHIATAPPPPLQAAGKRIPLDITLTEVTYQEQERALRLLQGLSLVVYDQRRVISEGLLIPYAVEIWQCCLQHVKALFSQRRCLAMKKLSEVSSNATLGLEEGPVQLVSGLETVVMASIDAVEAVCHYNPLALTRIVQLGGVRALLDLGLCPYAPYDIRCSVFDTISVLMQEVAPFRRAVASGVKGTAAAAAASGGGGGGGGGTKCPEDKLIQTMIQQAMTGGLSRHAVPPPYLMDRASASKFDSAVRDWFSQQGLSHVVSAVMELRCVRGTPIAVGVTPKAEVARIVQRVNQLREKRLQALLQAVDGKRAVL